MSQRIERMAKTIRSRKLLSNILFAFSTLYSFCDFISFFFFSLNRRRRTYEYVLVGPGWMQPVLCDSPTRSTTCEYLSAEHTDGG